MNELHLDRILSLPQWGYYHSTCKNNAIVAGMGCVSPDTKIYTEKGLIAISEIKGPIRVLSWNEKNQKFQLSLSGGAFPKGKENLYRVLTEQGEFVSTLHHQIFSSSDTYQQVSSFSSGGFCLSASIPFLTIEEFGRLLSSLDVQRYSQTDVNYLEGYATLARRYGQQFLQEEDTGKESVPLLNGVRKLCQYFYSLSFLQKDDPKEQKQGYNRLSQFFYRLYRKHSLNLKNLFFFLEGQILKILPEHILLYLQKVKQFALKSKHHHNIEPHSFDADSFLNSPLIKNKILQVSVKEHNVYYDMQVLSTNNYVCENGIIHHNSGKTDITTKRLLDTMFMYKGANMGYFAPTIPLIKDIFYPKISEELDRLKVNHRILDQKNIVLIPSYGKIFCRTMANPEGIVGFEILDAFLDEFDILKLKKALLAYRKIKARCRQKVRNVGNQRNHWKAAGYKKKYKPSQMFVSTTPEGFNATYRLFGKKPAAGDKNSLYLKNSALFQLSTYYNLHNLPDDYIDDLRATYPSQLIDAYILGKFVNLLSGTVYTSFDRNLNHAPNVFPIMREPLHLGMDFNIGKMSSIVHVIRKGKPIACDEFTGILDTPSMIKAIQNRYPTSNITVYPDASGDSGSTMNASLSDLKLLKYAGFRVKAKASNPRVKDRVNSMNAMFHNAAGERRYLVNTDICINYTESLEQQVYTEAGVPDKTTGLDHTNDAGGYFINFNYGITRPDSQAKRLIM